MRWPDAARIGLAGCLLATIPFLANADPLLLTATIPLGDVTGRMDHFAYDPGHMRLFLAELGNDSVGVIDLRAMTLTQTLTGFSEPQGLGYDLTQDLLLVANGGDGTVRRFAGDGLDPAGQIALGTDADNIHPMPHTGQMVVGYGDGAIAVLDPAGLSVVMSVALAGHPEGFQIDPAGQRIFVNVTDAGQVAVINISTQTVVATWPLTDALGNFPMTLDPSTGQVIIATRFPPKLLFLDAADGTVLAQLPLCADADDVMVDDQRHRLYVSCGAGVLDVFGAGPVGYVHIARIPTAAGARTAIFVPELDLLFVAARATGANPAAVLVFKPQG